MTHLTLTFALRPSPTTFNLSNARLVTLAPGLRPERRFAPLARGLIETAKRNAYELARLHHMRQNIGKGDMKANFPIILYRYLFQCALAREIVRSFAFSANFLAIGVNKRFLTNSAHFYSIYTKQKLTIKNDGRDQNSLNRHAEAKVKA